MLYTRHVRFCTKSALLRLLKRCLSLAAKASVALSPKLSGARIHGKEIQGAYATSADPLQLSPKLHLGQDELQEGSPFVTQELPAACPPSNRSM